MNESLVSMRNGFLWLNVSGLVKTSNKEYGDSYGGMVFEI